MVQPDNQESDADERRLLGQKTNLEIRGIRVPTKNREPRIGQRKTPPMNDGVFSKGSKSDRLVFLVPVTLVYPLEIRILGSSPFPVKLPRALRLGSCIF